MRRGGLTNRSISSIGRNAAAIKLPEMAATSSLAEAFRDP
jgi:hypothetical protein